MKKTTFVSILLLFTLVNVNSQTNWTITAENGGPYRNGTSVFTIISNDNNFTMTCLAGWYDGNSYVYPLNEKCNTKTGSGFTLVDNKNGTLTLTVTDFTTFFGGAQSKPNWATNYEEVVGIRIYSTAAGGNPCPPWDNDYLGGPKNVFTIKEQAPDPCLSLTENLTASDSTGSSFQEDIPISVSVTSAIVNPQVKVSLLNNTGLVLESACVSLGAGANIEDCPNAGNMKTYNQTLVLGDLFPFFSNWMTVRNLKFELCDSGCTPSSVSKTYNYGGYNQIVIHVNQYDSLNYDLEEYLIRNALITAPPGYIDNNVKGEWSLYYDFFAEDPYIKFSGTPDWTRGDGTNYPYDLSVFPDPTSTYRFARYQNTLGRYNWDSVTGISSGDSIPGGSVYDRPWVNSTHPGESVFWIVDGQYMNSTLLQDKYGESYLKIKVIVDPVELPNKQWVIIHEENYDDYTEQDAKNFHDEGITSYTFAPASYGWPQDGQYMITGGLTDGSNGGVPPDWNWGIADHTSGSGKMYVVNAQTKGLFYKYSMKICPGTAARLSAWFLNLCNGTMAGYYNYNSTGDNLYDNRLYAISPNVQGKVTARVLDENGIETEIVLAYGYTGEIPFSQQWEKHFLDFKIPSNIIDNLVTIELLNVYEGGQGNDFAIDDIRIERLSQDVIIETPSPSCFNDPNFALKVSQQSLDNFYNEGMYPDEIYFQWTVERWNGTKYNAPQALALGTNASNFAYNSSIGVINVNEPLQERNVLDYTFTSDLNGDKNPSDRQEKDRYTLTLAGSPDDLSGNGCASSASYTLESSNMDVNFISVSGKTAVCIGESLELQVIPADNTVSVPYYDWYRWDIEGDHDWNITDITGYSLTNPVYVGNSGADGKLTIHPEKTAVYKVSGYCGNNQYIIVNVYPDPDILFAEDDSKYINETTGVFTLRICSNDSTFSLPFFDTNPSLGTSFSEVTYKIFRVDENKENVGDYLKQGVINTKNSEITGLSSLLTQQDVEQGTHTETFVIELSLDENSTGTHTDCVSRIFFNVRNISDKAVWSPVVGSIDNWNSDANWKVYIPQTESNIQVLSAEAGIPMACTDVIVQGNSKWYPDLLSRQAYYDNISYMLPTDYYFDAQPICNTITFETGGRLGNQHHLDYQKAYVEYNFGHCVIMNVGDLINAKPTCKMFERNRYYLITSPLRDMVVGDLAFGGKPNAYSRYAEIIRSDSPEGVQTNIQLTKSLPYYDVPLNAGFGFAYKIESLGSALTQDQMNLHCSMGILTLPCFENEMDGGGYGHNQHHIWDASTSTSTFYYFEKGFPDNRLPYYDTKVREKWSGNDTVYAANRFITEDIYPDSSDKGTVKISSSNVSTSVLVGNPYFSYLDFNSFYADNQDVIRNYYYLYDGNQVFTYYPDANTSTESGDEDDDSINPLIYPFQSFFVEPLENNTEYEFDFGAQMTKVNPSLTQADDFLRSSEQPAYKTLKITADDSENVSTVVLIQRENPEAVKGGAPKIFSDKQNIPELYINQDGVNKSIVEISKAETNIPLGIQTSQKNKQIKIQVSGLNDFLTGKQVFLYDAKLQIKKELFVGDASYTFLNVEGNQANRFYLMFSETSTGLGNPNLSVDVKLSVVNNTIAVSSSPDNLIHKIRIYNIQGQTFGIYEKINQAVFHTTTQLPKGVYFAEINTQSGNIVKKMLIQ